MNFDDSPHEAAVRNEARTWLESAFPAFRRSEGEGPYTLEQQRAWQRVLASGGWGAPHWPAEYGGRSYGPADAAIWAEEKQGAGANMPFDVPGFGMAGPTIIYCGTDAQKERYLPALLQGDEIWCQLFSEPGAGSDLASLTTRAVRDGDTWIVNGQKVWSSGAAEADFGILLARCDFDAPKHKGLVYLLCDMRAPGVEVRPLKQMDGGSHFSEVFLTDVAIPDEQRVGEPGDGWRVAVTTLMNERMSLGAATAGFALPFSALTQLVRERGATRLQKQELARIYTQNRILEWLNFRIVSKIGRGQIPDAEGSVMKLVLANLVSESAELAVHLMGAAGMNAGPGIPHTFLGSWAFHLGGGTDEVQRNVIGERVLGLPREPQPDKDVPFSSTTR